MGHCISKTVNRLSNDKNASLSSARQWVRTQIGRCSSNWATDSCLAACAAACGARQVVHIWRWCLDLGFYIDFLFAGLVAGVVYPSCAGWWWWDEEVGVTVQSTAAVVLSPGPPPRSPPPAAPRITSHGDGLTATNVWINSWWKNKCITYIF